MIFKKLALAGALSVAVVTATASAGTSDKYQQCLDDSNGITVEMVNCINAEADRQDALLNMYYKKLIKNLEPEQAKSLKEAQRAWIKWRDASSAFVATEGGTMAIVSSSSNYLDILVKRVEELESYCKMYVYE